MYFVKLHYSAFVRWRKTAIKICESTCLIIWHLLRRFFWCRHAVATHRYTCTVCSYYLLYWCSISERSDRIHIQTLLKPFWWGTSLNKIVSAGDGFALKHSFTKNFQVTAFSCENWQLRSVPTVCFVFIFFWYESRKASSTVDKSILYSVTTGVFHIKINITNTNQVSFT